jgi:ParB-like nuclease domain
MNSDYELPSQLIKPPLHKPPLHKPLTSKHMHSSDVKPKNMQQHIAVLKTLDIANVVEHPDQAKYFRNHSDFEFKQLKADIKLNGIRVPPEVIPANNNAELKRYTIIKGMTRVKIWGELGHEKIKVLVRYDLLTATRDEIDKEFLLDNVARRQMDKLGLARAAVGLCVIERRRKGRDVSGDPLADGDVRDLVGKTIGMSGRNLQRYLNVCTRSRASVLSGELV